MLRERYNARRTNVIDICNRYFQWREQNKINDGIDVNNLKDIVNRLKEKDFVLAIAGEVKAGKSTFINALLGNELLPSGALQATSAIVEIFKSNKSFLKIKYASGRVEEIYDDLTTEHIDEAKEKLKTICSISDDYRRIPTTLINESIINSDNKIELTDDFIKELERKSGLKLQEYKNKIANYINEFDKEKIPSEIQFGYPVDWAFSEIRLVDTPGVNAIGGFEDVTFKFINNADAIIFVKNIKPVESKSLKNFVEKNLLNRLKEMFFLVLTHMVDNIYDKDTLLEETKEVYKHLINEEKIVAVDSILQQIYNDLSKGKTIDQIKAESPIKKSKISIIKDLAEEENITFKEACLKYSGFEELKKKIDRFSEEAPTLQLLQILDKIRNAYNNELGQYSEKVERLQIKVKDPQEYESEIKRIKEALNKLENDYGIEIQEFRKEYTGRNAQINIKIEDLQTQHSKKIESCKDTAEIRKTYGDIVDDFTKQVNILYTDIENSVRSKLNKLSKEYKSKHNITIPSVDLDKIEKESETKAYVEKKYVESIWDNWNWLKLNWSEESRTKYYTLRDESKLISEFKIGLKKELVNIKEDIAKQLGNIVDNFLKELDREFINSLEERKRHLDEEVTRKEANDKILKEIQEIEQKKTFIELSLKKIKELEEDMK